VIFAEHLVGAQERLAADEKTSAATDKESMTKYGENAGGAGGPGGAGGAGGPGGGVVAAESKKRNIEQVDLTISDDEDGAAIEINSDDENEINSDDENDDNS